jgi:hypothetical protein
MYEKTNQWYYGNDFRFYQNAAIERLSKNRNLQSSNYQLNRKRKKEVDKFTIQAECKMRYFQIMAFWLLLPVVVLLLPVLTAFSGLMPVCICFVGRCPTLLT